LLEGNVKKLRKQLRRHLLGGGLGENCGFAQMLSLKRGSKAKEEGTGPT